MKTYEKMNSDLKQKLKDQEIAYQKKLKENKNKLNEANIQIALYEGKINLDL